MIERPEGHAPPTADPSETFIKLGHERRQAVDGQTPISPGSTAADAARKSACNSDEEFPLRKIEIGVKDKRGREILDVLWAVNDFKIYKTAWGINPQFSDNINVAKQQIERYLALGSELSELNHLIQLMEPWMLRVWRKIRRWISKESVAHTTSIYYEREMARAIAQALTGDVDKGKTDLKTLAERLEKRVRNRGRVIYFAVCLLLSMTVVIPAIILLPDENDTLRSEVMLAAMMGSIGALLSTAVGLRSLMIDATATLFMNLVYGGQRMLVGVLGAIVVYVALRAGIALEILPSVEGGTPIDSRLDRYELAFVSVLAGFSERLVPNLLDRNGDSSSG